MPMSLHQTTGLLTAVGLLTTAGFHQMTEGLHQKAGLLTAVGVLQAMDLLQQAGLLTAVGLITTAGFDQMAVGHQTAGLLTAMGLLQAMDLKVRQRQNVGDTLVMMPIDQTCNLLAALCVGTQGRADRTGTVTCRRVPPMSWVASAREAPGATSLAGASRRRSTSSKSCLRRNA